MNSTMLIVIISIGAVLLLAGLITIAKIRSRKKAKKLQENLDKLSKEKEIQQNEEEENVVLSADDSYENISQEEFENFNIDDTPEASETENENDETEEDISDDDLFDFEKLNEEFDLNDEASERKKRDEEFEEFLDEHAFSRKIFDKNILSELNKMSPEVKAIIIENILGKVDGDQK